MTNLLELLATVLTTIAVVGLLGVVLGMMWTNWKHLKDPEWSPPWPYYPTWAAGLGLVGGLIALISLTYR